ncbi:YqgE/AlgH family protein [Leptospira sp. GIMC2001]|uniref:YqgE/AlgH family protein n=1 Tax=Leptospira sp. GIMC2001 TaxID=1513297 RepID=UPI0023490D97|nr:YqgE/AlgH family protein [Leptospira sp. GIMC2001]WCL49352.1 YqgE/AlgH family protein [Leptospira sp. GIMC2001]
MEKPASTKGLVLISNSTVVTDFFHKTVIFMVDHDDTGAFGIVLNKKSDNTIREIVKNVPDVPSAEDPVWIGGPVDSMFVCMVHRDASAIDPGVEVMPGIFMGRSYELLMYLTENNCEFRIFQGYAGWGAGQLESEFDRFSWVVHKPTEELIFNDLDSDVLWKKSLVEKGGIYKYFVEHTKDPMLN